MLPTDEDLRLRAVCALHAALRPPQRRALRALLRAKRAFQVELATWLDVHEKRRLANRAAAADRDAEATEKLKAEQARLVAAMCRRLPNSEKAKEVWEEISQAKDQKVARTHHRPLPRPSFSPSSSFSAPDR